MRRSRLFLAAPSVSTTNQYDGTRGKSTPLDGGFENGYEDVAREEFNVSEKFGFWENVLMPYSSVY